MATTAPSRGSIDVRELWSLPSLYHPVLSHGRDQVAFYWDKSGRIELYILHLKTRAVRQLSDGRVSLVYGLGGGALPASGE